MTSESLQMDLLPSYMELTEDDKQRCMENYLNEPLQQKHLQNKYIKRTDQILQRASTDNECFLAFDVCPLNFKYSTVIFTICGITSHFQYVVYMSIIEDAKLESVDKFLCDLLANMIVAEIPRLSSFSLKFILCRDNPLNVKVLETFFESKRTAKLANSFPLIREPTGLKQGKLLDPYVQLAWLEIMQGSIDQSTVRDIFHKHRELAEIKGNQELQKFVDESFTLARDLLETNSTTNLRLCTMERMDLFQQIVLAHIKAFNEEVLTRSFLFNLIRAIIHIYGY